MGLLVLAVVFVLGGAAAAVVGVTERVPPARFLGAAAVIVGVLCFVFSFIKTVGAREVGIPVTFGSIGSDLQPGVHLLAPWTVVHSCSLGQQQSIMSDSPVTGDTNGHDGVNINGIDQGAAIADVSILYHFDPVHANNIYRKYACNAALVKQNLIRQATRGAVAQAAATIQSVDLRSNRAKIATDALPIINKDFENDGIVVDNVVISDIILSDPVQQAANAKLQAQQAAQQAQFTLQKAQVDKQTAETNAQAAAAANSAQAATLNPNILCQRWIDAMVQIKPTTILTAGPCGGTTTGSVLLQVPAAGK